MSEADTNQTSEENVVVDETMFGPEFTDRILIGEDKFVITKLNSKKTTFIMNLLGQLLLKGQMKLKDFKDVDGNGLALAILAAIEEDMLVSLAAVLIGSDNKFAKENFDLSWVLEALLIQMRVSNLAGIMRNFTHLVSQIR